MCRSDQGAIVVRGRSVRVHRSTLAKPSDPTKFASMKSDENVVTDETLDAALYGDEHEIYVKIAAAIRGEEAFPVSPEDALQLTRVLDAIRASSEQNRVITMS